jgi:homoserine/homoserine lactone efflux protein
MIVCVAAGLGTTLIASAFWLMAAKYLGAAYLFYLGVKIALTTGSLSEVMAAEGRAPPGEVGAIAWRSFIVAVTNPKAYLFFAALLPQFISPYLPVWPQYAELALTFVAVELAILAGYALAGSRLSALLSGQRAMWIEPGCGLTLVAAALALLFAKRATAHS